MFTSIQNCFVAGEISPDLFGRTDLGKFRQGGSTVRNFFVSYRGGAYTRAGLAYVGMCKQAAPNPGGTATAYPPRDINFQFSINQGYVLEFGDQYMRIKSNGAYVTESAQSVNSITQANPGVITIVSHGYSNGDWVFAQNIGGMTELNGLVWIVQNKTTNTFTLTDLFGNIVNTTTYPAYTFGGTFARIYTVVSPYAAVDLPYLKFTQSADTMTLTCVNQITRTEYPSYELVRNGATNWTFTADSFASSIAAPTGIAVTAQSSTTVSTYYSYVVTAVAADGEESVASSPGSVENNDIAIYAGSNTITWNNVAGATSYNVYAATPAYGQPVGAGAFYGFIGSSFGGTFTDTNITADFTTTPPVHTNPFARGAVIGVAPTAGGSGYTQAGITYSITTSTGSGFVGMPVVSGGAFIAFIIQNAGIGYAATDTITITADGTGATAALTVGPQTGTYPGACAYYQQRRSYAATLNNPDTYYMSQTGAFNNMDASIPTTDSDAIIGSPWAQQINGIQFMVPMPNGLIILTGKGAWLLTGGNSVALTPSDQSAQPQAYNGCNAEVPPLLINYDILYIQAKGSIARDLSYNFFNNIYTGTDLTVLSNHLFSGHSIQQWCWAEEPFKIVWAIREDGVALSLTYLKEQDIYAWARHDTDGLFVGVSSVTEAQVADYQVVTAKTPYVDAVYFIVQRYVNGVWSYYSERMNDRQWEDVEECFCVDSGLQWPMTFPNATLTPSATNGTNNITSVNLIAGGSGYTSPVAVAVDPTGQGSGAVFSVTQSGGVITEITSLTAGINYAGGTQIEITDSTGTGAAASPIITNNITFAASSGIFTSANVGQVIRVGGGNATVTSYISPTQVIANVTQPITASLPNDPANTPIPQIAGNWSIAPTTLTVSGLNNLEGKIVTGLADGGVIPPQEVINGAITLETPASAITVGLPYTAQLQTMYLDPPGQSETTQSRRKNIPDVAVRVAEARGLSVGTNQPDQSTQSDGATVVWTNMTPIKERNAGIVPGQPIPLITGDEYLSVSGDWQTNGQIAIQQTNPLPATVLAVIAYYNEGDTPG